MGRAGRGRRRCRAAAALAAVLAATAGCADGGTGTGSPPAGPSPSPSPTSLSTVLTPARLLPGQAVPTPATTPVLTLTGQIGRPNGAAGLSLDVATIEELGLREVTLYEPWVKKRLTFQGVWLADLLAVAGVPATARVVRLTALDDYQIELPMADVRGGGILLATRTGEGTAIPVEDGGPTRIVFAGGVPAGQDAKQWIWSLVRLDVR